jgi:hypothetical protein
MSRIHITRNGDDPVFSKPIDRALLREIRLTYGARGLFAMLWDFPSDWVYYSSHIVGMSPTGMTQLKNYLKELRNIGAIDIKAQQLTDEEARALNEESAKCYKAGQIIGKQWVLNNPKLWAIEASLSQTTSSSEGQSPKGRFSTFREKQQSDKPTDGESTTKGFEVQGSPNEEPPQENGTQNIPFIFPKKLTIQEQESAKTLLHGVQPERAQELLDELAARLNSNLVRNSLGYLRSLIRRDSEGLFVPELSLKVAISRQKAFEELNKKETQFNPTKKEDIPNKLNSMHAALNPKTYKQEKASHG